MLSSRALSSLASALTLRERWRDVKPRIHGLWRLRRRSWDEFGALQFGGRLGEHAATEIGAVRMSAPELGNAGGPILGAQVQLYGLAVAVETVQPPQRQERLPVRVLGVACIAATAFDWSWLLHVSGSWRGAIHLPTQQVPCQASRWHGGC